MNTTKLTSSIAIAAFVGASIFTIAMLLGQNAADTLAYVAVGLLLVSAVRDYSPRRSRWELRRGHTKPFSGAHVRSHAALQKIAA